MPSSVNGCGTKYYGKRDFRPDGSYVTTSFFCLLFVPIFPIHSVRVIPDPKNSWLPFSKNYYMVLEKRWPHPIQVLSIYLWGAAAVVMGAFYFGAVDPFLGKNAPWLAGDVAGGIIFFVLVAAQIIAGLLLRNLFRGRTQ